MSSSRRNISRSASVVFLNSLIATAALSQVPLNTFPNPPVPISVPHVRSFGLMRHGWTEISQSSASPNCKSAKLSLISCCGS
ncbi:hypothetical protein PR001_g19691 [Phytophthora rubi]|uniref:RxLR effector protein n=2 Tax=Phytophthora TaxID=4783 RepID=A0A6A3JTD4_9STRA|nr:hypothetical protein PF011_g22056 [Phytophthora fragariae]KAE8984840.1 hypothetical protein PR002_g22815 [Phytophthora rubi]KAE8997042.1 hypothetical protein PR001_g19691 [Phytophthora rubi]